MPSPRITLTVAAIACLAAGSLRAQADVIVGSLPDVSSYGVSNGIAAYAIGTTSCNIGSVPLLWIASTNQHPVIGQNIYRVKDGVFEQVGMSWLKHGFTALQQNLCSPCTAHPNGSQLGVGCSDPYSSGLNGSQGGLGPRWQVNPLTGVFAYPFNSPAITNSTIDRRVQINVADVDPALNAGASYFAEGQYIAPDDAQAGNGLNNSSWRSISFSNNANFSATLNGSTVRTEPAIRAWPTVNPNAQVVNIDQGGERFVVGFNAISLGGGLRRYVYAVHNLNSDRAGGSFTVNLPGGAVATNLQFRGKFHHSGEQWNVTTPWTMTATPGQVTFSSPTTFAQNANGRALRWGQTFTFIFETSAVPGTASIGFYKPSTPSSVSVPAFSIPTELWQTNSPRASATIDGRTNNGFVGPIEALLQVGAFANLEWNATAGAPYDVFIQPGDAVAANAGGQTLAPGYVINLDLVDPLRPVTALNSGFLANMPAGGITLPFFAGSPLSLSAQLAALDPTSPVGVSLSAANELDVVTCTVNTLTHSLGDDASVQVTLGLGGNHDCLASVGFYGTAYTNFFINSNGSISFGNGITDFTATLNEFRAQSPRFAAMWTDLNPGAGGTITSSSVSGQITVQFTNVPMFGAAANTHSFAMVLNEGSSVVSVRNYVRAAAHTITTITGVTPGANAVANSVTYSSLAVGASSTFPANQVIYQLVNNGAPSGFTSLDFNTSGGNTTVTRVQ